MYLPQDSQVFQQDLAADQNQYDAAENLSLGLETCAEHISDLNADHGQRKRDDADEADRRYDIHVQEGKGDTYSQCIDTGCYSQ